MGTRAGIVASTLRPPSIGVGSFTQPAVNSTNYPTLYTSAGSVTRTVNYQVQLGFDTEFPAQYTATLRRVSDNATLGTPQTYTGLTTGGNQTARSFTGVPRNTTVRLDVTVTDAYGQTNSASSSNLTTAAESTEYINLTGQTFTSPWGGETYFGNLNDYGSNRTTGTLAGGAANAWDDDNTSRWAISGMTSASNHFAEVWCKFQYTEFMLRDALGVNIVGASDNAPGLVDDSMTAYPNGVRFRLNARRDSYIFYYDTVGGVFRNNGAGPVLGDINLNTFDNRRAVDFANNDSTDQPFINDVNWNEFGNPTVTGFTYGDFLSIRYIQWNISVLQNNTTAPGITDVQTRVTGTYTLRVARYR